MGMEILYQANMDDEYLGVLDYAIEKLELESVEIKFGQAAEREWAELKI